MYWKGRNIYVGGLLAGELVGIKENEEGVLNMYFGHVVLGTITKEGELDVPRRKGRARRKIPTKCLSRT
jgi:hypothetical protein